MIIYGLVQGSPDAAGVRLITPGNLVPASMRKQENPRVRGVLKFQTADLGIVPRV